MNSPFLSIILPAYKVEKYLEECIDSILAQNIDGFEIIVVDDGSPDSSGAIADAYAARDPRIISLHKPNGGLSSARNFGLSHARGKYIAFVDSDDKWMPGSITPVIEKAKETDADMIAFDFVKDFGNVRSAVVSMLPAPRSFNGKEDMLAIAKTLMHSVPGFLDGKQFPMSVWTALFKRDKIRTEFISEREVASEDLPFKTAFLLNADKVEYVPSAVNFYRANPGSLTHTFSNRKFYGLIKLTGILGELYKNTPEPHAGDMCMIYAMGCTLHHMYTLDIPSAERRACIKEMAQNFDWHRLHIDRGALTGKEKLMYALMRKRMWRAIWGISELFYRLK